MKVGGDSGTTEASADCPFCCIARGESPACVVYESPSVVAFFPDEPVTLGHTLVIPRTHVTDIVTANDAVVSEVAVASQRLGRAIMRALVADGLNLITSVGDAASQTVFHLHMHVVPRWSGDAFGEIWPKSPNLAADAKRAAAAKIRAEISERPV